ncbi:unnamed protein product, partial [Ectocarpus fasciculatus]
TPQFEFSNVLACLGRRANVMRSREATQLSLISTRAMANREMRTCKAERDRAFAELVYGRLFTRTGGIVRTWTSIIANIKRLLFLQGAVERAARQHLLEANMNRMAIVTRFMSQMALKRRRNRAVKVLIGALSAFTNSNAIGRYAQRVKWGTRHLQAVVRRRMACMTSHLTLLNRHWDRLYPPAPLPLMTTAMLLRPPSKDSLPQSRPGTAETTPATAPSSSSNKRPNRRKGVGGQGGQKKGRTRPKRSKSVVGREKKVGDAGGGGSGQASTGGTPASTGPGAAEGNSTAGENASQPRRPPMYVSSEAKHREIFSWLQRTRAKHCRDVINYERFTIFPCMVELLLQHERRTYGTRLQAVKHVIALRSFGRLSRVWTEGGYFAKMSHVLPPPPRMPRMFTPEEGDEMFDRAAARSTTPSFSHAAASIFEGGSEAAATPQPGEAVGGTIPSEAVLIEVETAAAAAAAAATAGEAAVKAVLGRGSGAGR